MTARLIIGDARLVLPTLKPGSVDCVVTSSPYPWQRAYLRPDDPAKTLEIGQEATPAEALDALLDVMDLVYVVLADHGTFWWNIGESHSGSGGAGGDYDDGGMREGQERSDGSGKAARMKPKNNGFNQPIGFPRTGPGRTTAARLGWPLDQSICWISYLLGASLAYGRNLLNGAPHEQWVTRPPVVWCKPSVSPGRLDRRFRTATELIIYGGKRQDHYFDLDAVRNKPNGRTNEVSGTFRRGTFPGSSGDATSPGKDGPSNPAGAPPFNWWEVAWGPDDERWLFSTAQFASTHYAVMPEALVTRPILAGCPEKVCRVCGKPRERLVDSRYVSDVQDDSTRRKANGRIGGVDDPPEIGWERVHDTLGWSECGCGEGCTPTTYKRVKVPKDDGNGKTRSVTVVDDVGCCIDPSHWRRGLVLDPFGGTGTVAAVANGHGRDAILIDLDERNRAHVEARLGMFLEPEEPARPVEDVLVEGAGL